MNPLAGDLPGTKRLRIAVFNRNFSATGGGAERYSIALVEQLAARHEIHVFAQQIDHEWPGVSYHKVSQPLRRPRWVNQLWYATATWWATRHGFDVVHSHENTWHGQVQTVHVLPIMYNLFVGRQGFARVLRWLKVLTSPRLLVYGWLERMRYANRPGKVIVVTSSTLRDIMLQSYPRTGPMIEVLTPGVYHAPGRASASVQLAARRTLGLPECGQCILFVGNDYHKKGLRTLLEAMRLTPAQAFLAVVGNAEHVPAFKTLAQASGLEHRVFFLGALKDVSPAYEAADCLAHPTQEDTFAMVVLEAMSHGLPVIVSASRYCGIAGLLTSGLNALVLQSPGDVIALRQLLLEILSVQSLADTLSVRATEFAKTHLWSVSASQQEKIYFHSLADHSH